MSEFQTALLFATLAGLTIPLGALAARVEQVLPRWHKDELRHSVMAFGGGVLFAAVALVLVPEGARYVSPGIALASFGTGSVFFFVIDRLIAHHGGAGAQLIAMLLDFVPESMAIGALLTTEKATGFLLAALIALQNFPEGFNAYRELLANRRLPAKHVMLSFLMLVALGPLAAWFGFAWLRDAHDTLGAIMLFAAGGIFYLTFEDIAPQAHLERHWGPPLGAVAGFMLGLLGYVLV